MEKENKGRGRVGKGKWIRRIREGEEVNKGRGRVGKAKWRRWIREGVLAA